MKSVSLNKITSEKRALYLSYDQGLEHGPESDFNDNNVNPLYIIEIAKKGKFNGIVFHKGIAEKYHKEIKKSRVPLILKLNGKTRLVKGEPISANICTVKEAIKLGAKAVGYTVYLGSLHENKMIEAFEKIQREAHKKNLPVILWAYPRGKKIKNDASREVMAYSARAGLELGADIVKIKYNDNVNDLKWAVESAGRCKVVIAGGIKQNEKKFLKQTQEIMKTGVIGLAIGRNVWQSKNPLEISKKLKWIIKN